MIYAEPIVPTMIPSSIIVPRLIASYYLYGGDRSKYSVYQSRRANLRRWAALAGVDHPEDLSPGSTRKAWESWLIESGLSLSRILASQGHDMNTSMKHYYNNDVTPEERIKMKEMTQGWG